MSSGFNVIRRHSLDSTGIRIKELTQALATQRSKLEGSSLETDDVRSMGRMDHSTIKLNDERLSFATILNASNTDFLFELPYEPDLNFLKVWLMLDHLGVRVRDISGFGNDARVSGHPTLRRAPLDLGFQQLRSSPATPVMLFNSGTDAVSQTDGEYIWVPDNDSVKFVNFPDGFSIHFRFSCLNFGMHFPAEGGQYSRRFAAKTDDENNGWAIIVNDTGNNTGSVEFDILDAGIQYAKKANGYQAGMWYQVVITYNRNEPVPEDRIKIYTSAQENSVVAEFGIILSTTFNLRIGARSSSTGFFYGYIHDFRLYMGKILTQQEVTNVSDNEITIEATPKGQIFIVQYALVQGTLASRTHKWQIVGRIIKVKIHRYNVIKKLSVLKTHKWNEFIKLNRLRTHKYTIVKLVQRLLTIVYDQGGRVITTKTHKYSMGGKATKTKTHKWNVTGSTPIGITTQYKRFQKSTTAGSNINQVVTYNSTPQAIIVWSNQGISDNIYTDEFGSFYGFSDGVRHSCISGFSNDNTSLAHTFGGLKNNKVIAFCSDEGVVLAEASVTFQTNQATFNWSTNDTSAIYIHTLAIWGATTVEVNNYQIGRTTTGNQTYNLAHTSMTPKLIHTINSACPLGWDADDLMSHGIGAATSTDSFCINYGSDDGVSTSFANSIRQSGRVIEERQASSFSRESYATLQSLNTGSFTLNWADASPSTSRMFGVLAIESNNVGIGTFTQPITTGNQNTTTPSTVGTPTGLMLFSTQQAGVSAEDDCSFTIGGASGTGSTDQGLVLARDADNVGTMINVRTNRTGAIMKSCVPAATATSSTTTGEASLSTLSSNQFTLNWTTSDGSQRGIYYIALGQS